MLALGLASLAAWVYLLAAHGRFWRADQRLGPAPDPARWPDVCAVVPARNEAAHVAGSLRSLLDQDYPGRLAVILVDDGSEDDTAERARRLGAAHPRGDALAVRAAPPPPPGWSGKLWALHTGVAAARSGTPPRGPAYLLLTDADVEHPPAGLRRLVAKAEAESLDLVSLMVLLAADRGPARLLVPAFVYFFQLLYPFRRVNDPRARTAAAAGGCILLRPAALGRSGGLAAIRGAVIDDCALARRVKRAGRIWLGLAPDTRSTRTYARLADVWTMVTRTAFDQLGYSAALLAGTLLGLALVFGVPPVLALLGDGPAAGLGALAWAAMALSFLPTLRLYRRSPWLAPALPLAALAYAAMTLDSARRHWTGAGTAWRGRRRRGRPPEDPEGGQAR